MRKDCRWRYHDCTRLSLTLVCHFHHIWFWLSCSGIVSFNFQVNKTVHELLTHPVDLEPRQSCPLAYFSSVCSHGVPIIIGIFVFRILVTRFCELFKLFYLQQDDTLFHIKLGGGNRTKKAMGHYQEEGIGIKGYTSDRGVNTWVKASVHILF